MSLRKAAIQRHRAILRRGVTIDESCLSSYDQPRKREVSITVHICLP